MSEQRERLIERAHGRLLRVLPLLEAPLATTIDLEPGGQAVEAALAHLLVVDEEEGALTAACDAATEASRQLDDGDAEEDVLEAVRRLLGEAVAAMEEADRIAAPPLSLAPSPVRASVGVPTLQVIDHDLLLPRLRLPPSSTTVEPATYEPLPAPTTHDELEGHGERAKAHIHAHLERVLDRPERRPAEEPTVVTGAPRFVERWARECLEEAAMLGSQRRPLPGDDWRTSRELEDRLVHCVDAFASLVAGPAGRRALDHVEAFVLDAPAPDPWRLFSAGLLLGSLAGRDTLGMVDRLARASARDPDAIAGLGGALRVCPHPRLFAMLRDWLEDSDPAFRAVAADVLVARDALAPDALSRLLEDRWEVAAPALAPLALRGALPEDVPRAMLATAERGAGIAALALVAKNAAVAYLRGRLDDDSDWAAPWLACFGGREDGERILELALRHPTPSTLDAVAIAGLPVVDRLLSLLSHEDAGIALATARALDRITGAGLRAVVEVPAEQLLVPELPEPSTGGFIPAPSPEPEAADEPRGAHDRVQVPPPDAALWGAWWREHRERFELGRRYRRGLPLSPQAIWAELDGPWLGPGARRRASQELLAQTRKSAGFDSRDFVCQQEAALLRWQQLLA